MHLQRTPAVHRTNRASPKMSVPIPVRSRPLSNQFDTFDDYAPYDPFVHLGNVCDGTTRATPPSSPYVLGPLSFESVSPRKPLKVKAVKAHTPCFPPIYDAKGGGAYNFAEAYREFGHIGKAAVFPSGEGIWGQSLPSSSAMQANATGFLNDEDLCAESALDKLSRLARSELTTCMRTCDSRRPSNTARQALAPLSLNLSSSLYALGDNTNEPHLEVAPTHRALSSPNFHEDPPVQFVPSSTLRRHISNAFRASAQDEKLPASALDMDVFHSPYSKPRRFKYMRGAVQKFLSPGHESNRGSFHGLLHECVDDFSFSSELDLLDDWTAISHACEG